MEFESNGLDKAGLRKKRRKKERIQAFALLIGAMLLIVLALGIGIVSLVHMFSLKNNKQENATEMVVDNAPLDADVQGTVSGENEAAGPAENIQPEKETENAAEEGAAELYAAEESMAGLYAAEGITSDGSETGNNMGAAAQTADKAELLEERIENQIAGMSIEAKVAQLFFLTPEQLMGKSSVIDAVGSDFNAQLNEYQVGGIVLKKENMENGESLSALVSNIRLMANTAIFVGVTDEGGEDSPFVQAGVTENVISSQKEIGESLGIAGAYSAGISLGSELKKYGFDVDFAPVGDVSGQAASPAAQRGFGVDASQTAELAKSMVRGLSDQGIHAAAKYFPSYSDVRQDGSNGQVISQRNREDLLGESQTYLETIDAGADFVMISHVSLPKLRGDNRPASLSKEVITDIVREEWGFDGIVITDYMDKSCMYQKYTYAEAAVGAIEAGADMLLSVKNFEKSYNGILDAVKNGSLPEERIDESLRRIFRVKFRDRI